jgi:AcrR family transcriptional regulator
MNEETGSKERLLAAAWELARGAFDEGEGVTRTTPRVFDQLTAARVSKHAGLTTGAFYNRWLDRDAFLVDFLEYALAATRSKALDVVTDLLGEAEGLTPEMLAVESIKQTVEATIKDTAFAMHMYLWALSRNREVVVEHLRSGYEDARNRVASLISLFLAGAGREYRPPFTDRTGPVMMIALVEGLALQRSVDPDRVNLETVERAVIALWGALSREPGDERTGVEIFENGL